jgi:hypothetical protein
LGTKKINIFIPYNPIFFNLGNPYTIEEATKFIYLFREFEDIFAWSYENLKEYENSIIQYTKQLKEGVTYMKKKLRMININLKPLIKIKLEKMLKERIIVLNRHLEWVSHLVLV